MGKITHIKPEWFLKRQTKRRRRLPSAPLTNLLILFRPTLVQLLVTSTLIFLWLRVFTALGVFNYFAASILALLLTYRSRWLWPLIKRTYDFIPFGSSQVQLFYDPILGGSWRPSVAVEDCERNLQDLSAKFSIHWRRRLLVYYFADAKDISRIFGQHYGATALTKFNALVIANGDHVQETIRHELTHLLAAKWNTNPPPLLTEGIATWLAGARRGQSIDSTAQAILLDAPPKLEYLLRQQFFYSERNRSRCYTLAASFTGFLIRTYGWERYKKLYRHSYGIGFRLSFKQLIGVRFDTVEAQWREEIISGRWSKRE